MSCVGLDAGVSGVKDKPEICHDSFVVISLFLSAFSNLLHYEQVLRQQIRSIRSHQDHQHHHMPGIR